MAAQAGYVPLDTHNALEALMFGALISATDPVCLDINIGLIKDRIPLFRYKYRID